VRDALRPMICVSIMGRDVSEMERKAERAVKLGGDLIELRLDFLENLNIDQSKELVSRFADKAVVTLRPSWEGGRYEGREEDRMRVLDELSAENPAYMDVELRARWLESISERLRKRTRLIVSSHNFSETPEVEILAAEAIRCLRYGDLAKIVITSKTFSDNLKILKLYGRSDIPEKRLIAFAMGERGVVSRILSPLLGSPIAYACLPGEEVASGQLSLQDFKEILRMVVR